VADSFIRISSASGGNTSSGPWMEFLTWGSPLAEYHYLRKVSELSFYVHSIGVYEVYWLDFLYEIGLGAVLFFAC